MSKKNNPHKQATSNGVSRFIKIIFAIIILIPIFLSISGIAHGIIENPLEYDTLEDIIEAIIRFIRDIALVIAPIMLLVTGLYFLASGGNPEKVTKAKKMLLYILLGLLVILMAEGLVYLIRHIIRGKPAIPP